MKKRMLAEAAAAMILLLSGCSAKKQTATSTAKTVKRAVKVTEKPTDEVTPGTSQEDAKALAFGKKVNASVKEDDKEGWFSFKTDDADGNYTVSAVNRKSDSDDLRISVKDEDGNEINNTIASVDGKPCTISMDNLDDSEEYYLTVSGKQDDKYALYLTSPSEDYDPSYTIKAGDEKPASNSADVTLASMNEKLAEELKEGNDWYAFRTADDLSDYKISTVITDNSSDGLRIELFNVLGESLGNANVGDDGSASTIEKDDLDPDTVYLVSVSGKKGTEYTIQLNGDDSGNKPQTDDDADSDAEAPEGVDVIGENKAGSNQLNAPLLNVGTRYTGKFGKSSNAFYWYAFKTGSDQYAEYSVSVVDTTVVSAADSNELGRDYLNFYVYDQDGNSLNEFANHGAGREGAVSTFKLDKAEPNTTYNIKLEGGRNMHFTLMIRSSADKTVPTITSSLNTKADDESNSVGTNQSEATSISLNKQVSNTLRKDPWDWYVFKTAGDTGAKYSVSAVNETPQSNNLKFYVYDEYGNKLNEFATNQAENDGKVATYNLDKAELNTTYYIGVSGDENCKYTLNVKADGLKDASKASETKKVVFEKPFSLDETQVKFKPNSDEFVDESAARSAIKPIADQILKYPDHKILLAGTTATFGNQSAAEKLSSERADAVKNMLVDEFKVPSSQLETAGLGYEKDPFERAADMDVSGNFIESEAKKNRRVVVLDADSDMAKKALERK